VGPAEGGNLRDLSGHCMADVMSMHKFKEEGEEYKMSKEPSSVHKNSRMHRRVDWGQTANSNCMSTSDQGFNKMEGGERGSVAQHTHKNQRESWATIACYSARQVHRFYTI